MVECWNHIPKVDGSNPSSVSGISHSLVNVPILGIGDHVFESHYSEYLYNYEYTNKSIFIFYFI
jgi:hypothetical protein